MAVQMKFLSVSFLKNAWITVEIGLTGISFHKSYPSINNFIKVHFMGSEVQSGVMRAVRGFYVELEVFFAFISQI
jgi:hypothetical protein